MMDTDDTTEPTDEELMQHWTVVLAEVWRQTDWDQFSGQQKRRVTAFDERLTDAVGQATPSQAIETLAHNLSMAAPELPTENLDPLVEHPEAAMRVLDREQIYLANKASETVDNYFRDLEDGDDPEPTTSELSDFVTEA